MPEVAGRLQPAHQTFLSFDFGTRRVGVAVGNTLLGIDPNMLSQEAGHA